MNINRFKWLFWTGFFLIFFLPLLSLPPWFSPPDWGKTILFRIILSLIIFVFIWQTLLKRKQKKNEKESVVAETQPHFLRENWVVRLLIVLWGIFFLATIFSQDIRFSFWDSPHRSGGFLNFSFYIIFALLALLILNSKDWKKLWNFSFFVAILAGLIAVFQKYKLFSGFLIPYADRPASTIGGPIFLAIYLLLLIYLALSFAIKSRGWKRLFYFSSVLFFLFVILISGTRAAYFGALIGFLYFLFLYPNYQSIDAGANPPAKKLIWLKILAGVILILGILAICLANTQSELPQFVKENKILRGVVERLSIERVFKDPRISGWKVGFEALKARPILGYGPENFSIGFDKFYDPSLPHITQILSGEGSGWWDRAHNFLLEIPVNAGIPALIIYLAIFVVLFWQLQKIKNTEGHKIYPPKFCFTKFVAGKHETTQKIVIAHGIQATFIAYLTANFFSFDTFSSYLISFSLIAYSLSLLRSNLVESTEIAKKENKKTEKKSNPWRFVFIFVLFCVLVWFILVFNIKPLRINSQINVAYYQHSKGDCLGAIARMEKILPSESIINHHLRLKYIDLIGKCVNEDDPVQSYQLGQKAYQILKENIETRPSYTRNWILLAIYCNFLAEKEAENNQPELSQKLLEEANLALKKAQELSPKRQEILVEWVKTDLLSEKYQSAYEKTQKCLEINPELRDCYWLAGIINIYLKNKKEAEKYIELARQKDYNLNSELSLLQIAKAYITVLDYQELIKIYQKLIKIEPNKPQYYASLATCYKEIGDFVNARKEALKVLELAPESKRDVELFLQTLR